MTWFRNLLFIVFGGGVVFAASISNQTSAEFKAGINQSLNEKMTTVSTDYTANIVAMQPIITKLEGKGWVFTTDGRNCAFERKYKVLITRTPEHQAVVEKRGEVSKGDNTYESGVHATTRCRDTYGEEKIEMDYMTAMGNAALEAFGFGDKHANWLRDL